MAKGASAAMPMQMSKDPWQAEDDHRTLQRAEEIKGDRGRMAGVRRHHRKMTKAMNKIGKSLGGKR